jgi:drug/metabolite transporter (DMT)-like permease
MGAFLALVSALAWGVADYLGGIGSRKVGATALLVVGYPAGAVILTLCVFLLPGQYSTGALLWGVAAGTVGTLAIALLYVALSRGPMGVVSPLTAVMSGAIPVAVGLLRGERLTPYAVLGILLAAVAVTLVSRQRGEHARIRGSTILISLGSGTFIGLYLSAIGTAPADSGIWAVTIGRWTSSVLILVAVFALARNFPRRGFPWLLALCCGFIDASANGIFQLASQHGRLAIVAVLGSLYPAATAVLARFLLHERLEPAQLVGVALALAAAALLALP